MAAEIPNRGEWVRVVKNRIPGVKNRSASGGFTQTGRGEVGSGQASLGVPVSTLMAIRFSEPIAENAAVDTLLFQRGE